MEKNSNKSWPRKINVFLRRLKEKKLLNKAYKVDKERFKNSAYCLVKETNLENIEAQIIYHYHSLEKGLSNINFRNGFGKRAYSQLIHAMNEFYTQGYDRNLISYQTGLSVLNEYIVKHKNTSIDVSAIKEKLDYFSDLKQLQNLGGVFSFQAEEIIEKSAKGFESLALNRFSVRDYSSKPVDIELIQKALTIARKTPSVCNRQQWHTHVIRNKELIQKVLKIQGGFRGHGHNLSTLLLVTADNYFLSDYTERNQGFIDCGMYSMSLIYSLQYLGLATCPLNADLTIESDNEIRKLLNLTENQSLIMFIAVGHYEDEFKVPKSPRDDIERKATYYN